MSQDTQYHVVNVSGGAASAVVYLRVLERYGPKRVVGVFANTNSEDPDLYRFLDDLEKVAGKKIVRINNHGVNIWDVFKHKKRFTVNGMCLASYYLKRVPLLLFTLRNFKPDNVTIHIGMGIDEDDRRVRIAKKLKPWRVRFPLCWKPVLWSCDILTHIEERGLKLPDLYRKGYPHNNCGGGCILAGIRQWAGFLGDYPDRYAVSEDNEHDIRMKILDSTGSEFSILKDRRGDKFNPTPYTLRELRTDVENGRAIPEDIWRTVCSCMTWEHDKPVSLSRMTDEFSDANT